MSAIPTRSREAPCHLLGRADGARRGRSRLGAWGSRVGPQGSSASVRGHALPTRGGGCTRAVRAAGAVSRLRPSAPEQTSASPRRSGVSCGFAEVRTLDGDGLIVRCHDRSRHDSRGVAARPAGSPCHGGGRRASSAWGAIWRERTTPSSKADAWLGSSVAGSGPVHAGSRGGLQSLLESSPRSRPAAAWQGRRESVNTPTLDTRIDSRGSARHSHVGRIRGADPRRPLTPPGREPSEASSFDGRPGARVDPTREPVRPRPRALSRTGRPRDPCLSDCSRGLLMAVLGHPSSPQAVGGCHEEAIATDAPTVVVRPDRPSLGPVARGHAPRGRRSLSAIAGAMLQRRPRPTGVSTP